MTGRPLLMHTVRTGVRMHLLTVAIGLSVVLFALMPLARIASLGRAERAAMDLLLGGEWAVVCVLAIALGVHVAARNPVDALLSARGLSLSRIWLWRLAGAALLLLGTLAVSSVTVALAGIAGWIPLSAALIVWAIWLALEALVVLTMASALRRLVSPAAAWAVSLVLWLLGHLADETIALATAGHTAVPWLYAILPDLDRFNGHTYAITGTLPTATVAGLTGLTAALWAVAWVGIGLWTLRR